LPATALEQDLGDAANPPASGRCVTSMAAGGRAGVPLRDSHLDVRQARDIATGRAHKVGVVIGLVATTSPLGLKPPDVVAQVHAGRQAGLGKLDEVSVDRGAIEAERMKSLGDVGMRERPGSLLEMPKHGHPSGRTPKPSLANKGPHGLVIQGFGTADHPCNLRDTGAKPQGQSGRAEWDWAAPKKAKN